MKKIIFIIILMFACFINVEAHTIETSKNVDKGEHLKCRYADRFDVFYNKDGYPIKVATKFVSETIVEATTNFWNESYSVVKDANECPDIYYCMKDLTIFGDVVNLAMPAITVATDKLDFTNSGETCEDSWTYNASEHFPSDCKKYNDLYDELKISYKQADKTDYNRNKDSFLNYCNHVLSKSDYADTCVKWCLNINDDIEAIEEKVNNTNDCGLSDEIIIWIENILRWIKYIVPVILIVLSIIDFIKAITGEKEDEMKKAQKNFVTRLIVAVLIFIFPTIVEFVLDKMGFDATNCEIKNIGF